MRDVEFVADQPDARAAVVCEDVADLVLRSVETSSPTGGSPVFDLRDVRDAFVTGVRTPAGAVTLAQVSGVRSNGIVFAGNVVDRHQKAVRYANGASETSATVA